MENVGSIKKYFFTNDEIVIKYKNKSIEKKKINRLNLKKLSDSLEKQYDFNIETVMNKQDYMYSLIAYVSFILTLLEGIIFLNLLIAFEIGRMKQFIVCSILSGVCIFIQFVFLLITMIIMRKLNKKYKICIGKEIVLARYNSLVDNSEKIEEVIEDIKVEKPKKKKVEIKDNDFEVLDKEIKEVEEVSAEEVKIEEVVEAKPKKAKVTDEEKLRKRKEDRKKKAKAKKRKARKTGSTTKKKTKK